MSKVLVLYVIERVCSAQILCAQERKRKFRRLLTHDKGNVGLRSGFSLYEAGDQFSSARAGCNAAALPGQCAPDSVIALRVADMGNQIIRQANKAIPEVSKFYIGLGWQHFLEFAFHIDPHACLPFL